MIVFYAILVVLILYKIKLPLKSNSPVYDGVLFTDYMSIEKTTSVKGIFIFIVLICHASYYLTLTDSFLDRSFDYITFTALSQSMVSMFMFYSGYGVMLSIEKKGANYIKSIPKNRVFKVLLHFDIAVLLYLILKLILKDYSFTIKQVLLSLIAWDSLENPNWYIFAIALLYLFTFISFIVFKNKKYFALSLNLILICAYIIIMHKYRGDWTWYNTVLCYFAGMLFYNIKPLLETILRKFQFIYWILLVGFVFGVLFGIRFGSNLFITLAKHILFACVVILVTMKFGINNKILYFFGKNLFPMYILHRLPMIVFSKLGVDNKYIFVILSFAVTVLLCIGFNKVLSIIDNRLFKNKTA